MSDPPRLTVLDFGMGNIRSVAKALERAGAIADVRSDIDPTADALVVPGQGAFGSCVTNLGSRVAEIASWIGDGKPYFGICLGLQVLFEGSAEEPGAAGAGVFAGHVERLPEGVRIPHIGWNDVDPVAGSPLFRGLPTGTRFYFVHSFYPVPADESVSAATVEHGTRFSCAAVRGSTWATQFHPEKSADAGATMLRNVVEMVGP